MPKKIDLTGERFGRWKVISLSGIDRGRKHWKCQCDCGAEKIVRGDVLTRGISMSCGCLAKEINVQIRLKHGYCINQNHNGNSTYVSWKSMKQRCYNPNTDQYHRYGALGVHVCDRWLDSFENFVADMGERPQGTTLDRINPYGNYEPNNCRWADAYVQNNNQRRHCMA